MIRKTRKSCFKGGGKKSFYKTLLLLSKFIFIEILNSSFEAAHGDVTMNVKFLIIKVSLMNERRRVFFTLILKDENFS